MDRLARNRKKDIDMKPVKRSIQLQPLSRDHHHGLLFCWKIRQGLAKDVEMGRMQGYVKYFYAGHLQPHFKAEEDIIESHLDDQLCAQAVEEHKSIAQLIKKITIENGTSVDVLNQLIELLNHHIRFEERTLFPHLEVLLSPEELHTVGLKLADMEKNDVFVDAFPDEFWITPKG